MLYPIIWIINEDEKQDRTLYWTLRYTTGYWPPTWLGNTDCHPFPDIQQDIQSLFPVRSYTSLWIGAGVIYLPTNKTIFSYSCAFVKNASVDVLDITEHQNLKTDCCHNYIIQYKYFQKYLSWSFPSPE